VRNHVASCGKGDALKEAFVRIPYQGFFYAGFCKNEQDLKK